MSFSVSAEDKAFTKLEKITERLFDLGFNLDNIISSVTIRYGELAHPDYVTQHCERCQETGHEYCGGDPVPHFEGCSLDTDHEGQCMARLPYDETSPESPFYEGPDEVTGWCDDCGLEVTDPESACPAQERPEDSFPSWTVEKVIELTKRLDALEDRLSKPTAVINQPPLQFGGMGATWSPPPQRPQNTCACDH